jgi:hypothetical protein
MKKQIVLMIVLLVSTVAAGCIDCKNFIPVVNPTIAPTVGPSQQAPATVTPMPSGTLPLNFKEYETGTPPNAHMANDVLVSHPTYYMRDDLEMPVLPEKGSKPAHHGVIHKLEFWNPTGENQTIDVNYFPSAFIEKFDGKGNFVPAQQMFYDPIDGFLSVFEIGPHERRTIFVYAYITDEDFEKYHGLFTVGGMSITMMPPEY